MHMIESILERRVDNYALSYRHLKFQAGDGTSHSQETSPTLGRMKGSDSHLFIIDDGRRGLSGTVRR